MDDRDLIIELSRVLIQLNDEWDRYTIGDHTTPFIDMMQYDTRKAVELLDKNKCQIKRSLPEMIGRFTKDGLKGLLDDLMYGLNRNNVLYSQKKELFDRYVLEYKEEANKIRNNHNLSIEQRMPADEVEEILYRSGDWYRHLNEICNEYLQEIRKYIPDAINIIDEVENVTQEVERSLPKDLDTDEVKALMNIAIKNDLLNDDYSPTNKTKTNAQKALLADIISQKANLKHKWKPFETLWNVKGLAQQRYDSKEKIGKVNNGDIIENAFK